MKRAITIVLVVLVTVIVLVAPPPAVAQGTAAGRYYTKADVERIIKRVEGTSDEFRSVIDRSLDRSALDGTNREDNINQQVKELENAIDRLRREFDRVQTWEETRAQVRDVLNEADEVNVIVRRSRTRRGGPVRNAWATVRSDLNKLFGVYKLRLLTP